MIDVEGAEREVLEGIRLDSVRPRWILIENNRRPGGDGALRRDILADGYRMVARLGSADASTRAGIDPAVTRQIRPPGNPGLSRASSPTAPART